MGEVERGSYHIYAVRYTAQNTTRVRYFHSGTWWDTTPSILIYVPTAASSWRSAVEESTRGGGVALLSMGECTALMEE